MTAEALWVFGLDTLDRVAWDEAVLKATGGAHSQTSVYAEYVHACRGAHPVFVEIREQSAAVRLLLFDDHRRQRRRWFFGPVFAGSSAHRPALMTALAGWLCRDGYAIHNASTAPLHEMDRALDAYHLAGALKLHGVTARLGGTVHIALDTDLETRATWRSSNKTRKVLSSVRRSRRQGVEVRSSDAAPFRDDYRALMAASFRRNGIADQDPDACAAVLARQDGLGQSVSFLAEHRGEPLAAVNVALSGGEASLRKLAYNDACRACYPGTTDHLIMSAAEWARAAGLAVLHFPILRLGSGQKDSNLRRFKSRFGGDFRPVLEFSGTPGR